MSTSVKRSLDIGETDSNVPLKTSRFEDGENDDRSDTGSTIEYVQTVHEDVFYATNVPTPHEAREALNDNDDSVIIVLTKKARETFLSQFQRVRETEQRPVEPVVHVVERPVPAVPTASDSPRTLTYNTDLADYIKKEFDNTCETFNKLQRKFPENVLQKNLESADEFAEFRDVRKVLTDFYVGGSKVANMIAKVASGEKDYLLKVRSNLVPNKLDTEYISAIEDELQKTVYNLNVKLFNETLIKYKECSDRAKLISQSHPKILAKAWRTVRLSHGDIKNIHFYSKRNRLNTETTYEPRPLLQEYNQRQTEYDNKDRETYRPQQRTRRHDRQQDGDYSRRSGPKRQNNMRSYPEDTYTEDHYNRDQNRNQQQRKERKRHDTRYFQTYDSDDEYYEQNRNRNQKNVWNRRNSRYSDNLDTEDDYSQFEQKRRYSRDFPPLRHNRNRHLNQ